MRISDDTRYPHPVLSVDSGDYSAGAFEVAFQCQETFSTGKVTLQYQIELDNPDILALVESGAARVGAFVRCRDTYFSALEKMAWPSGQIDFPEGVLLDRVYVRPIIWLTRDIQDWRPKGVNPEFPLPLSLKAGEVLAIALESRLTVGKAKLAPLESIFSMKRLTDIVGRCDTCDLRVPPQTTYGIVIANLSKRVGEEVLLDLRFQLFRFEARQPP